MYQPYPSVWGKGESVDIYLDIRKIFGKVVAEKVLLFVMA